MYLCVYMYIHMHVYICNRCDLPVPVYWTAGPARNCMAVYIYMIYVVCPSASSARNGTVAGGCGTDVRSTTALL